MATTMEEHALEPGTLLNLAAVARMMHADGRLAEEEVEIYEGLRTECDLDEADGALVDGWAETPPEDAEMTELAAEVDAEGRSEALALSWVVALADGAVDPSEEATLSALAAALDLQGREEATRAGVEATFYGAALTILAAVALMVDAGDEDADPEAKRLLFAALLNDLALPEDLAAQARDLLVHPRPLHELLSEATRLAPDFQEALLGNLWAVAWADGQVVEAEQSLFSRFERACGVPRERVLELQLEWGPAG